jgi:hypothetical protein
MDPKEYDHLRKIAEQEGVSVAELVRKAVADRYFLPAGKERKQRALAGLFSLRPIPVEDWSSMKKDLSDRYGSDIP